MHGYDVVDPTRLNPELGTEAELEALVQDLRARDMGLVLDIVPNHMAASSENDAWVDVLRHGQASRYARWFDIEWRAPEPTARFRVVLPVLGDARAKVLERDEINVVDVQGEPRLQYWEHHFPLHPQTVATVRHHGPAAFGGDPEGRERMRRLLDAQVYRLVHWRRAARDLNYRRFFDVNELVALHMEDSEVFAQTHALVLEWRRRGWIDGFRIDHPDGLLDPYTYFVRLIESARTDAGVPAVFLEKILTPDERLRDDWPVDGTTGYDFLNEAEAIFVHPAGADALERDYRELTRLPQPFSVLARAAKRRALQSGLSAGVRSLAHRLHRLSGLDRPVPPVPLEAIAAAIIEVVVALPVYRTYVDDRSPVPAGEDSRLIEQALADARTQMGAGEGNVALDAVAAALLATDETLHSAEYHGLRLRFAQRFQQLSGPATAKGVEDTAFYSFTPLLSRNEVGGDPEVPLDDAIPRLHHGNRHRAECWPRTLLAATTHDTKRSADARARLDVLSECSAAWEERLYRWRRWNRPYQKLVHGRSAPDASLAHHLYQAMVAIWPLTPLDDGCLTTLRDRLSAYAIKASREAKMRTTWTDPDADFEGAVEAYVASLLDPARSSEFLDSMSRFVTQIARVGLWNGFARTLLQLTAPGIPDVYQGDELWNFSLVDPDNRRPVDFQLRTALLDRVNHDDDAVDDLVATIEDGRLKLYLTRTVLWLRRHHRDLFLRGGYLPLEVEGPLARHLVAFARHDASVRAVVLVPRLLASLVGASERPLPSAIAWDETSVRVPAGWPARWHCELTKEVVVGDAGVIRVQPVLGRLPGGLLIADA